MQKLYCYVDETGQDTTGIFFLVSLIITGKERDDLRGFLRKIELRSGKGKKKWTRATFKQKQAYIKAIVNLKKFQDKIFYRAFSQTTEYLSCIIDSIVSYFIQKATKDYRATILIDGLGKHQRRIVGSKLRRQGVKVEKVRGLRDESDEFIRLADAIAGFVRDYLEGKDYSLNLYQKAARDRIIKRL